jgi:two-component system, chemotaxis family, CheB/CheR fusion protein
LPVQKAAATGQEVRESEITVVFDDGTVREMLGNAAPLLDREGKVRGAIGVFVDITEHKRAEQALQGRRRHWLASIEDLYYFDRLYGILFGLKP